MSRRIFIGLKYRGWCRGMAFLKKRGKSIMKLEYQRKPKLKENSIEIISA